MDAERESEGKCKKVVLEYSINKRHKPKLKYQGGGVLGFLRRCCLDAEKVRDFKKVSKVAREKGTDGLVLTATDQSNSCKKEAK